MAANLNVVRGGFGAQAPEDLSRRLRELADLVDGGHITSLVAAFVEDDIYTFLVGASLRNHLVLSTLLHKRALDGFEGG